MKMSPLEVFELQRRKEFATTPASADQRDGPFYASPRTT